MNSTKEASKAWKVWIDELSDKSLFPTTKSMYIGGSRPGKAFEQSKYAGQLGQYGQETQAALSTWMRFEAVKA